jgi:hypothetical protein
LLGRADCVEISSASCESSLLVLYSRHWKRRRHACGRWRSAARPSAHPRGSSARGTKRTSGSRRAARVSAKLHPGDETRDTDGDKKSSTLDALDNILPKTEDPSPAVDKKEIQTPPKPMGGTREERAAREVAERAAASDRARIEAKRRRETPEGVTDKSWAW